MGTSGVCMSNEFPGKPSFMLMQVKLFLNRWILLRIPGLGYQIVSQTEMMFELRLSSLATLVGRLYIWSYLWYAESRNPPLCCPLRPSSVCTLQRSSLQSSSSTFSASLGTSRVYHPVLPVIRSSDTLDLFLANTHGRRSLSGKRR